RAARGSREPLHDPRRGAASPGTRTREAADPDRARLGRRLERVDEARLTFVGIGRIEVQAGERAHHAQREALARLGGGGVDDRLDERTGLLLDDKLDPDRAARGGIGRELLLVALRDLSVASLENVLGVGAVG